MLTANVGHGQDVADRGNASLSAARANVPSAPPAKIAAISRRSARGSIRRFPGAAPAGRVLLTEGPGTDGISRLAGDSGNAESSFVTVRSAGQKPSAAASGGSG